MSRRPPLKPIRTVGATDTNFSTSHTLQSIQENEDNVDHCVTSQTPPFEDNNQHVEALSPLPWNYYFQARAFVLPEHYRGLGFRVYAVGSVTFQLAPWTSTDAQSVLDISTTTAARSANTQPLLLFFHGGGYSALSFGFLVKYIMNKLPNPESLSVLAFDARGHGETVLENEEDLSTERQVEDALDLLKSIYGGLESNLPPVVLAGHSMGGAIAVHVGASGKIPTLCGLIVIDVVEGTAVASLPHMQVSPCLYHLVIFIPQC